jgi:hypothetical protein
MVTTSQPPPTVSISGLEGRASDCLPPDIAILLDKTTAHVAHMLRSIEVADRHVERSIQAVLDSEYLLARLRRDGL